MDEKLVATLKDSKNENTWAFGSCMKSMKLNFDVMANPRANCFYLWGHLGVGGSGCVVLASDTDGRVCAIKIYVGRGQTRTDFMNEGERERRLFRIAYREFDWSDSFRVAPFGSRIGLIMPHFCAIPEKDRKNCLEGVKQTLTECFLRNQLRYSDMKWHHVMRFRESKSSRIVVVDMGQCVEEKSGDDWVEDQIAVLKKRLISWKLDLSPDSSGS